MKITLDIFEKPSIIINVSLKETKMSKINPIALELRSGKYKQRIVRNKKRYDRKRMNKEKYNG